MSENTLNSDEEGSARLGALQRISLGVGRCIGLAAGTTGVPDVSLQVGASLLRNSIPLVSESAEPSLRFQVVAEVARLEESLASLPLDAFSALSMAVARTMGNPVERCAPVLLQALIARLLGQSQARDTLSRLFEPALSDAQALDGIVAGWRDVRSPFGLGPYPGDPWDAWRLTRALALACAERCGAPRGLSGLGIQSAKLDGLAFQARTLLEQAPGSDRPSLESLRAILSLAFDSIQ